MTILNLEKLDTIGETTDLEIGGNIINSNMDKIEAYASQVTGVTIITPQERGLDLNNPDGHQDIIDSIFNDTTIKAIRFPAGVYRAYINNRTSDRTLIFDDGSIIDGIIHLATGSGPQDGIPGNTTINEVKNTTVIGTLTSTVRIGTYYCNGVSCNKFRITEINPEYVNQTAEGGSKGVHLYYASKNINIGEIILESATASIYGVGIDTADMTDAEHRPTDITIGRIIAHDCNLSLIHTNNTTRLSIGSMVGNYNTYAGCWFVGDDQLYVGNIKLDGTGSVSPTASLAGIYVLNCTDCSFGDIISKNCAGHGFYTSGSNGVRINSIRSYNNDGDGVKLLSSCYIQGIEAYDNGKKGINMLSAANNTVMGNVKLYNNGEEGFYASSTDNVTVKDIVSYDHTAVLGHNISLTSSSNFKCDYISAYGGNQGLRYIDNTDCDLGIIRCNSNTTDIALAGTNNGISFNYASYEIITGGKLQSITGFKGSLTVNSLELIGDDSIVVEYQKDSSVQYFNTPLTANRTVTINSTGAQNGGKFKIIRSANASGAFTLTAGSKVIAQNSWAEFTYSGLAWIITGSGVL